MFSNTMTSVDGNARLVKGDAISEVARLKSGSGGDLGVGGAGLAAGLIARDLVDEYRLFINPLLLGGGTPFFPALNRRLDLDLLETRQFGPQVVYLRYRRRR